MILIKSIRVSDLLQSLPSTYTHSDRIANFKEDTSLRLFAKVEEDPEIFAKIMGGPTSEVLDHNKLDGLRITFKNKEVVHLRRSGNAPELRCYTETSSILKSEKLCKDVLMRVTEVVKTDAFRGN